MGPFPVQASYGIAAVTNSSSVVYPRLPLLSSGDEQEITQTVTYKATCCFKSSLSKL